LLAAQFQDNAAQFHATIAAAKNTNALDEIARMMWPAHAKGHLLDADATAIQAAIQNRRAALAGRAIDNRISRCGPRRPIRRHPRSPDKLASVKRRRRQVASGAMPPRIADNFTFAEQAALAVVARLCRRSGLCVLYIDAIASLAGVCRTVVKDAMRHAKTLGLITVQERRRPGLPSLTNIVRVISRDWLVWLKMGGGVAHASPTITHSFSKRCERGDFDASLARGRQQAHDARLARSRPSAWLSDGPERRSAPS